MACLLGAPNLTSPPGCQAGLPDLHDLPNCSGLAGLPLPAYCMLSLPAAAFARPLSIEMAKMRRSLDPCRSKLLRVSVRTTPVDPFC